VQQGFTHRPCGTSAGLLQADDPLPCFACLHNVSPVMAGVPVVRTNSALHRGL
jgi:hypothetical protein